MRLGAKITLIVLTVSVLFVNLGIYAVFQITYRKNISEEQNRGLGIYQLINHTFAEDLGNIEKNGSPREAAIGGLVWIFESSFQKQRITMQVWKGGRLIGGRGEELPGGPAEGKTNIVIRGKRYEKEVLVWGYLEGMEDEGYVLSVSYPLAELNSTWRQLGRLYAGISLLISLSLLAVLGIFLHILLRPIGKLSEQVRQIREGNYQTRLCIHGNDELALLVENVNAMADTIQEKICSLKEESERKQQFIDDLSHEMKSPLTSIYGYAEYMTKARLLPGETEELCGIIMEESNRLRDMSKSLLCLSELHHTKPQMEQLSANDLLAEVKRRIEARESARLAVGDILVLYSPVKAGLKVRGSRELLVMLLVNLIQNGIHACRRRMEEKADRVEEAGAEETERQGEEEQKAAVVVSWESETVCTVRDTGCGIPQQQVALLTEPFYRVDKGRSRKEGGNGLGLAICERIAKAHGGTLSFDSRVGEGTKVTIRLWEHILLQ